MQEKNFIGVDPHSSAAQLVLVIGLRFFQMHLRHFFKRAGDHETRVGEVETLADNAREVQDLGDDPIRSSPRVWP
jgi:hypothetical protein